MHVCWERERERERERDSSKLYRSQEAGKVVLCSEVDGDWDWIFEEADLTFVFARDWGWVGKMRSHKSGPRKKS